MCACDGDSRDSHSTRSLELARGQLPATSSPRDRINYRQAFRTRPSSHSVRARARVQAAVRSNRVPMRASASIYHSCSERF